MRDTSANWFMIPCHGIIAASPVTVAIAAATERAASNDLCAVAVRDDDGGNDNNAADPIDAPEMADDNDDDDACDDNSAAIDCFRLMAHAVAHPPIIAPHNIAITIDIRL